MAKLILTTSGGDCPFGVCRDGEAPVGILPQDLAGELEVAIGELQHLLDLRSRHRLATYPPDPQEIVLY